MALQPRSNRHEKDENPRTVRGFYVTKAGDDLLSQEISLQVPSAQAGLTAVFEMGTGVTPPQ